MTRRLPHTREQGVFAILSAPLILLILGMCALAIDLGLAYNGSADPVLTPIADSALPSCLANRRICLANPNAANCIRFVRVRFCATDGSDACNPIRYEPLVPLIPMPIDLPSATSINVAESFDDGRRAL